MAVVYRWSGGMRYSVCRLSGIKFPVGHVRVVSGRVIILQPSADRGVELDLELDKLKMEGLTLSCHSPHCSLPRALLVCRNKGLDPRSRGCTSSSYHEFHSLWIAWNIK